MSHIIITELGATATNQTDFPERRLWAAVLLRGIQDAVAARQRRYARGGRRDLPPEALPTDERWLMDPSLRHIGSFEWICSNLGLEADHLRKKSLEEV